MTHRSISAVFLAANVPGTFAGNPDAAKSIVVQHCVKCNAVPDYNPEGGPTSVEAPSFSELATDRRRFSEERLRAFPASPHWPMTKFDLSRTDVDNLVTHIQSLGR